MKNLKTLIALSVLIPSISMAASDGPLQSVSSSGELIVSATVDNVIGIRNVDDVDFGTFSPGVNITASETKTIRETVCVFTNANSFEFELSSRYGSDGGFGMVGEDLPDEDVVTLPYNIALSYMSSGSGTFAETIIDTEAGESQSYGPFEYSSLYDDDSCGSSFGQVDNVFVYFQIAGSDVVSLKPGSYFDEVTITARIVEDNAGGAGEPVG